MIRFSNDYSRGAHPAVLKALEETNDTSFGGYGKDPWCEKAADLIRKEAASPDADIHFLVGGTQTNFIVIAAALRHYQGVISADTGHINVHETCAVEGSGYKIIQVPHDNGKLNAEQIREQAEFYLSSPIPEHIVEPKMVYISFPTEFGTTYSLKELQDISAACRKYGYYLFIDGARLSYGLAADGCDVTLADLAGLADVFYCGGTKCGAMMGEAVVITNPELSRGFRSYMKQNGALLAKGWLLGVQFYTLFKDRLYFDIAETAVEYAMRIKKAFADKGIHSYIDSPTNQQFVVLSQKQIDTLSAKYIFESEDRIDDDHMCMRFCTSWSTSSGDVDALVADIAAL